MTNTKVFLFAGQFRTIKEACLYSEPQWEPEPDDTVSDEEYRLWEDRNPIHKLKDNIKEPLINLE